MPESGIPLADWSGSAATNRLRETITEFNATTAEQTAQLVRLTKALVPAVLLFVGPCRPRDHHLGEVVTVSSAFCPITAASAA